MALADGPEYGGCRCTKTGEHCTKVTESLKTGAYFIRFM